MNGSILAILVVLMLCGNDWSSSVSRSGASSLLVEAALKTGKGKKGRWGYPSNTSTPTISTSLSMSATQSLSWGTWSEDLSASRSLTTTITRTITPPPTPTSTLTQTAPSDTFSFSSTFTDTMTFTGSMTVTVSATLTSTVSLLPTLTAWITPTQNTPSFSLPITTSAIPPTTSAKPTPTKTLLDFCAECVHGMCNRATQFVCTCWTDSKRGYWLGGKLGGACKTCLPGYYGPSCTLECPGTGCNPCNGHGTCSDGTKGSGTCACFQGPINGYWEGVACSRCVATYYGHQCTGQCNCGLHGTCDEGYFGSGSCKCEFGWEGKDCSVCDRRYVVDCIQCPNKCSGHGSCRVDPQLGAQCTCDEFYATDDCSVRCPGDCSGYGGICSQGRQGNGTCSCLPYFTPPACDSCDVGYWGRYCNSTCNCTGHGVCNRDTGRCQCNLGYVGPSCGTSCPTVRVNGTATAVCSGHGICTLTGACTCYLSRLTGYWSNSTCNSCLYGFGGPDCSRACPTTSAGVCAAKGFCDPVNATCRCNAGSCGLDCAAKVDAGSGACAPCPQAVNFGPTCQGVCNCTSNGNCDAGLVGTGTCQCQPGWWGPQCGFICPGGVSNPCSNQGTCDTVTGQCACNPLRSGGACELQCPDCGPHGKCDSGSLGTNLCICDPDWVWPNTSCTTLCNCSGIGQCTPTLGCICPQGFTGRCDACLPGLWGKSCNQVCVNGDTVGKDCVCRTNVGGALCEIPCPTYRGSVCGGNGLCNDGIGQPATCSCFSGHVGPACQCNEDDCSNPLSGGNSLQTCSRETGLCGCVGNRGGSNCNDCKRGFWGANCQEACRCNNHGLCDRVTGVCSCDADFTRGFWGGDTSCSACLSGYVGEQCNIRASSISQFASLQSRYNPLSGQSNATENTYVFLGPKNRVHAGGSMFHTVFNGDVNSEYQDDVLSAFTLVQPPFCPTGMRSWLFGTAQYIFASRGVCAKGQTDYFELFSADPTVSSDGIPSLPTMRTLHSSPYDGVAVSVMFLDATTSNTGIPTLCYVPAGQYAPAVPILICIYQDGTSPPFQQSIPMFASVKSLYYVDKLGALFLGGSGVTGCQVAMFRVFPKRQQFSVVQPMPFNPIENMTGCVAVECVTSVSNSLVVGASTSIGTSLYTVLLSKWDAMVTHMVLSFPSCTAVVVDPVTMVGMAAIRQSIVGSTIIKFRLDEERLVRPQILITGSRFLASVQVPQMAVDPEMAIIYAVVRVAKGVVIARLGIVSAEDVSPVYADRRGGTTLTVVGVGFYNSTRARCRFGDALTGDIKVTPALVQSDSKLTCLTPSIDVASCGAQPLQVAMGGWDFTQNQVTITRVDPPFLQQAIPERIFSPGPTASSGFDPAALAAMLQSRPTSVTVVGQGFVPTDSMACQYTDGLTTLTVKGRYGGVTAMVCDPPPINAQQLFPNGTLSISLDGAQYTPTNVPFVIVGGAAAIRVSPSVVSNTSSASTSFSQPVQISTVDRLGNLLGVLDAEGFRPGTVWFQRGAQTANVSLDVYLRQGTASFDVPRFAYPERTQIIFNVVISGAFRNIFTVVIEQGEIYRFEITQQPRSEMTIGMALTSQLQCYDISNNSWYPSPESPTLMACEVMALADNAIHQAFPSETVQSDGSVDFTNMKLDISWGTFYQLIFSLKDFPAVTAVRSIVIQSNCGDDQFQFQSRCERCLEGANCNGSSIIILKPGFWRDNSSIPTVYPCERAEDCLGGAPTGGCATGYEGPLCTLCVKDYGRNQNRRCTQCQTEGVIVLLLIVTTGALFVAVIVYIILCLQYCDSENNLLVVVVIIMNCGQGLTTLPSLQLTWPDFAIQFFNYIGMICDFELHSLASDCEVRRYGKGYLDKAAFYYAALIWAPFLALLVKAILKCFPNIFLTRTAKQALAKNALDARELSTAERKARRRNRRRGMKQLKEKEEIRDSHKFLAILSASIQVYLFLTYQTTANHALKVFNCADIISGTSVESLMVADYSISCHSQQYKTGYGFAIIVSVIYGLILPVLSTLFTAAIISKFRSDDDIHLRSVYLPFQLLGLRESAWYWPSLVLVKKFVAQVVSIWNPAPLDSYFTMWVYGVYTGLVWYIRPYKHDPHNFLEIFASYTVVATIKAGLLYTTSPWEELKITDMVVMFVLYFILALLFLYYSVRGIRVWILTLIESMTSHRFSGIAEEDDEMSASDIDLSDSSDSGAGANEAGEENDDEEHSHGADGVRDAGKPPGGGAADGAPSSPQTRIVSFPSKSKSKDQSNLTPQFEEVDSPPATQQLTRPLLQVPEAEGRGGPEGAPRPTASLRHETSRATTSRRNPLKESFEYA